VAAGGDWTVDVELRNGRDVPVIYSGGPCGAFASLTVTAPIPLEPEGQAWTGMEAGFKSFALAKGLAAGGVPATNPMTIQVADSGCQDFGEPFPELAPGDTRTQTISWTAQLIGGLDPLPGPVEFAVSTGIDPDRTEPPPPTGDGPIGLWFPNYTGLSVSGRLTVEAGDQHPISIGQAIDAVLGEVAFTGWLAAQPAGTCTGVNVFLTGGQAGSILPVGPNWEIDVFCEQGVPRHWLIATVDPFTAEVTGINRCDVPCDR
jgi:hypothetical protein